MARSKTPEEVEWAIRQLQADNRIIGCCPDCGEEYPLRDWLLFYGNSYPKEAAEAIKQMQSAPGELRQQYLDLKRASTVESGKISVRVKLGQIVEQIAPGLPTFPYEKTECRSLFKPIDYLIFEGLAREQVRSLHFVDIKTGDADVTDREKDVKRLVDKRRVEFVRY